MVVMSNKSSTSWCKNRPSPWSPSSLSQTLHLVVLRGHRDKGCQCHTLSYFLDTMPPESPRTATTDWAAGDVIAQDVGGILSNKT